jgi:hypothetical protein
MPGVPLEEDEQIAFVQWCRLHGIIVHHSGNEIGGSTPAMKARALKMKRMGTSAGFPDLVLFIPVYGVTDEIDTYQPAFIEMKRKKGSTISQAQKGWLKVIDMAGIPCAVCKGAEAAVEFVEKIEQEIKGDE